MNHWDDRGSFVKVKGKYGLVETDENDDDDGDGTGDASLGKLSEDQIHKASSCEFILSCQDPLILVPVNLYAD